MIERKLLARHERRLVIAVLGMFVLVAAAREPLAACSLPGNPQAGKAVYEETCIACHGKNGRGAIPGVPNMTATGGSLSKPDDVLIANITNGFRSGKAPLSMPPLGGNPDLTDDDVVNVLGYMRKTFGCK